jgi:chromosome segregation ATPase
MSGNKVSLLLGIICFCLIGSLIYRHTQAVQSEATSQNKIEEINSKLTETTTNLGNSQQTNVVLRTELEKTTTELGDIRLQFQTLSEDLNKEKGRANAAVQETRTALAELADRDVQIKELTSERKDLSQRVEILNRSMDELEKRIEDTESKLTASDGDRAFLLRELKRLQTEKSGIERQFNDLSVLRAQLNKLRNELTISRRIQWIRRGLTSSGSGRKGAELLSSGFQSPVTQTNYNLNVEINQSGGVKILELPPSISPPE